LSGFVAVVTGGAQGIGKGIVFQILRAGANCVCADIDSEAGNLLLAQYEQENNKKDDEQRLMFVKTDVSKEEEVERLVNSVMKQFSRVDTLINNAGVANPYKGPIEELSLDVWNRYMNINLTGPFLCVKHFIPHLRKSKCASIINIASTRALQAEPNTEAYCTTKGGIVALTQSLAISLGPQILVNTISPGWIDVRSLQKGTSTPTPLSAEDHQQHPCGRVGEAADIASLVEYLMSPSARFITGQNFVVDGGITKKMIYKD